MASRAVLTVCARLGVTEGPVERGLQLYLLSPARLAKQLGWESLLSSSIRVSSAGNLRMYLLLVSDVTDASCSVTAKLGGREVSPLPVRSKTRRCGRIPKSQMASTVRLLKERSRN